MDRTIFIRAAWITLCGLTTLGIWGLNAQEKAQEKRPSIFTGGKVTPLTEGSKGAIAHFRFDAGARTKWHSHSEGQIILVEEGVGLVQDKGGPILELHAGEVTFAKPGVIHWHGAGPKDGGVQYNVTRGEITWGEEVTDAEFTAPTKRLR